MSRSRYEEMKAGYEAQVRRAQEKEDAAERRHADLLEKYHALKASGASAPLPLAPAVGLEKKGPDRVQEVIADVAGNNSQLRAQLLRFVRNARFEKKTDDEIIQQLMHWPAADDDADE